MKEEVGTERVPSDAARVDVNLFGDAAEDPEATATGDEGPTEVTEQDGKGPQEVDNGDADGETGKDEEPAAETGEASTGGEKDSSDELKVVLSIRDGRATIGVQRPSSDPHIESFDEADLAGLAQKAPTVVERARARWEQDAQASSLRAARTCGQTAYPAWGRVCKCRRRRVVRHPSTGADAVLSSAGGGGRP